MNRHVMRPTERRFGRIETSGFCRTTLCSVMDGARTAKRSPERQLYPKRLDVPKGTRCVMAGGRVPRLAPPWSASTVTQNHD
jgi:hypothetical protein